MGFSAREKAAVSGGLSGLALAVTLAHRTSPQSYEIDIYAGPPAIFWILILIILLPSVVIALRSTSCRRQIASLTLATAAMGVVLWLPIIRGYWFYDEHDPMTHIGYAKSIHDGTMNLSELFYPGIHHFGLVISEVTGLPIERSLLFMAFSVFVLSILPLVATSRALSRDGQSGVYAAVLGLCFIALYPLTTNPNSDPTAMAIFFSLVPLTLVVLALRTQDRRFGIALIIAFPALYMFHPQQMLNFMLFTGMLLAIEIGVVRRQSPFTAPVPMIGGASIFTAMMILIYPTFQSWLESVVGAILIEPETPAATEGRMSALAALDISVPVLFLRFFAKDIVLIIGVLAVLGFWFKRRQEFPIAPISYLAGLIPVVCLFGVFMAAGYQNQIFRYFAMGTLLAVPLAAVGFRQLDLELNRPDRHQLARIGVVALLCVGLLVAIPSIHPSPYTERPGAHVPEGQVNGFDTMFGHADESTEFAKLRSDPIRYYDATRGYPANGVYPDPIPAAGDGNAPDHFEGMHDFYDGPFYLPVTQSAYQRDAELWQGYRYSAAAFAELDHRPDLQRVYDNNHTHFYRGEDDDDG